MVMPISCRLTDIYGYEWAFNQDGRVRLAETPTGLMGAEYEFDEYTGPGMAGVVVVARNDTVNIIGCKVRIDGPKGNDGRDLLVEWRKAHGRGFGRQPGGPLMKFEVEETGRYQMVRPKFKNSPDLVKMHAVGRALDEVEYRSDETWWRTDPLVTTFSNSQFVSATVINDGDEPSWPHYKIVGPFNNGAIGLMGEDLSLPNIAAGNTLEINTDPLLWKVEDQAGVDKSLYVNSGDGTRWHTKAPVDGGPIPVTITGTGTTSATSVTVTVPQLFWTAL
jgi:hypothetical protein